MRPRGEVAERSQGARLDCVTPNRVRGFESHPLRQIKRACLSGPFNLAVQDVWTNPPGSTKIAERFYESRIRREFLDAAFDRHGESLQFLSAELSTASYKVLSRKLERLAAEFRDLADLDRSLPAREKQSVAAVLAARSWVFSMFAKDKKIAG